MSCIAVCRWLACLLILPLLASCGADKPADTHNGQELSATTGAAAGTKGKSASSSGSASSDMPIPPKDAQYTIYCQVIPGPDHLEHSRALRQALKQGTSLKDWYIIHGNGQSTLYYGFYRTVDPRDAKDGKEGRRAIKDLNTIRAMVDSNGFRPFSASVPVPIDAPDPSSNPAWDLARTDGFWTVEIAVYKGSPDRKQAAVDAVRAARQQGVEAYYYHGQTASSVCIGSWPREAVREIDTAVQNTDPDKPIVVTPQPMSQDAAQGFAQQGMQTIAPSVEVMDPTVTDILRRYPEHAINGEVPVHRITDPAGGQVREEPEHSKLVKVEHHEDTNEMMTAPIVDSGGAPGPAMREPAQRPGVGQLKSLGD